MSEKKAVTVTIYGNEYTMKGEADPQYIADLAKFVDVKMNEIGKKTSAPAAKVAILASMNIADEYHRLEKAKADNLKLIETLEKSILEMKKSSDGSLKHTLELREQMDKLKNEAADSAKRLEEALSHSTQGKKEAETLKTELEKAKRDLESASRKHEETSKEMGRLKEELHAVKPQLEKLRQDLQASNPQVEKLKEDLTAAESLTDEAQSEIQDLRAQNDHLKSDLAKLKNAPPPQQAAGFLPSDEKLNSLFKKIDAILE